MESTTRSANQDSAKATTANQPGASAGQAMGRGDANSGSNPASGSGGNANAARTAAAPGLATRTVDITGMTGDACVQKVAGALKEVPGVEVQAVKVGSATIRCDQAGYSAACAAIARVGYKPQSVASPVDGAADPHDANTTGEHAGEQAGELAGRTAGQAGGGSASGARGGESSRGDSRNTSAGGGQHVTQPNPPHTQNPRHAGNDRANGPRPVMPGVHGDEGDTVQRTDQARKADPAAGTATK